MQCKKYSLFANAKEPPLISQLNIAYEGQLATGSDPGAWSWEPGNRSCCWSLATDLLERDS